ncbi:hypothetical protein ACFQLX_17310 [Streptomyces polyrhachis]|uniref:Uncharacterized protein n=1 Tax=Streptomyces polyrhachis TaxID=1282885 RepID=A0ABW2GGL9_9ACTN
MDGRSLSVMKGLTGHPPKWYDIPVPDPDGGPTVVHSYLREVSGYSRRLRLVRGWRYVYVPEGRDRRPKWPWGR